MNKNNNILFHNLVKKKLKNIKPPLPNILHKFFPIQYEEPERKDLAIILVYFNPNKSNRIIQNILLVKHSLEVCNIPFYITELAFNDEPFIFKNTNNVFQYRTSSYMFYKENLIYTALQFLPDTITKICTLDADIMFDDPKWYEIISNTLDTYNVCQPFNFSHKLNIDFTIENTSFSCINSNTNSCCGYAWAFKKDWFLKNGFFEYALIGGGDSFFYNYVMYHKMPHMYNNFYTNEYTTYLNSREKLPPVCSVNLNIYHLFHGNIKNRQYISRHHLFEKKINSFNITNMNELFIRRDDNIIEWNPKFKDVMNTFVKTYFMNRQDDSL